MWVTICCLLAKQHFHYNALSIAHVSPDGVRQHGSDRGGSSDVGMEHAAATNIDLPSDARVGHADRG